MSVAIVGHGPSLLEQEYGAEIDEHIVVRQKRCEKTLEKPDQYGTRTDYICGSHLVDLPKIGEAWPFDKHTFLEWNKTYRQRRTPYTPPKKGVVVYFSPLGHDHLSTGFHTLLYACEVLGKDIVLYGFDSMKTGEFTWSVTRGPMWTTYPDHNWETERDMIPLVEQAYGLKVSFR